MRLDEPDIDLHGWLRAFYGCPALGRSFVMDHNVQRPLPSHASFSYSRQNYHLVLRDVLAPLGLRLVQGRWIDAVVLAPASEPSAPPSSPAPLAGASGGPGGGAAPDSAVSDPAPVPEDPALPAELSPRRLRAKASGLLRTSARRMGFSYSELLASASRGGVEQLWEVSASASDSLGTLDFARIVHFSAHDTARVIFGSEHRRAESTLNYENGTALTQYSSLFDGLTVDVRGDRWSFVWRGSGSLLEVPGHLGSCAFGSSSVDGEQRKGVPFLSRVPGLRWLFSIESRYHDDLLVVVCLEED